MQTITVTRRDAGKSTNMNVRIDRTPDECPVCHRAVEPPEHSPTSASGDWLERVLRCPRAACGRLFIARYKRAGNMNPPLFAFSECVPVTPTPPDLGRVAPAVSPIFCEIYAQAAAAEQHGLLLVCGPAYRKALEFLIKDYLCALSSDREEEIKATPLGRCIADFVENEKIKTVAARAAWLGNDETHYLRKWEDRDLGDLKKLTELTVHWIEMEEITKEAVADMPAPAKPSPQR